MFPARATGRPARRRISAIQAVVVDLPFVPVTATHRFFPGSCCSAMRQAISSSARIGMPRPRAAATAGESSATPGETASQPASSRNSIAGPSKKNRAPRRSSSSTAEAANPERGLASPIDNATSRSAASG